MADPVTVADPGPVTVTPAAGLEVGGDAASSVDVARRLGRELAEASARVSRLARRRRAALVAAHDAGMTWEALAEAVGMHRVSLLRVVREGRRPGAE